MMHGQEIFSKKSGGRDSQKNRTRKELVAAADTMIRAGRQPTVAEAAEAAGISRATAYRYFPTQEMLLAEVSLFSVGGAGFPAALDEEPVPEAVSRLVRRVGAWTYENEQALRTLLRLSLDPASGVRRPGHRTEWIAQVLAPCRSIVEPEVYDRLSRALTLMFGIDPIVVMRDIADVSQEQALDALEWSARTLVEAAIGAAPRAEESRKRAGEKKDAKRTNR
jgi:AcrR family transcriptional regulator